MLATVAMATRRGFFNVATLVITSALTGDDSPSLLGGFTGSSGQSDRERTS